jgi:hypothetical protein
VELGDFRTAALLVSAADHAAEAAAVEGDAAAERAWAAIEAALDADELESVRRRGASAPRVEVVSEALAVIAERLTPAPGDRRDVTTSSTR